MRPIKTFGDIRQINDKVQALLPLLHRLYGVRSAEMRAFEAEYDVRMAQVGDAIRMEHGDLDPEAARNLPLSTPLGIPSMQAVADILSWLTEQLKLASGPVS